MLQCCLNGQRKRSEHPTLPVSPAEVGAAAAAAVAAGADELHVHPKDVSGADTLEPDLVAVTLISVRNAVPGVPVGITTGAWIEENPDRRVDLVAGWTVLPDYASVNWHEKGSARIAETLLHKGIGVEAGLFTGTYGAQRFRSSGLAAHHLRILVEVMEQHPQRMTGAATEVLAAVADLGLPILLHGETGSCWPILRMAVEQHFDRRIGVEDTLIAPDGRPAADNAQLIREARALGA